METIAEKLEEASRAYTNALIELDMARLDFHSGAGLIFSKTRKDQEDLLYKIAQSEDLVTRYEKDFQEAFRASGFVRTDRVKELLNLKLMEVDILQELKSCLVALEAPALEDEMAASRAAMRYRELHSKAYKAWVHVQAYEYLAEHGAGLGRILALASRIGGDIPAGGGIAYHETDQLERLSDNKVGVMRQTFVMDAIKAFSESYQENAMSEVPAEIGELDLGIFSHREVLTTALYHRKRIEIEEKSWGH